ncbi:sensor histidine kinase [Oceaniglobus ichthyenteri]|uniref:sensor histidine kinase n=1 Tax=Oceaniglobus ichthyenteri TaxID=2136177 RepID=UPI000D367305|nr:sensor histidine kinase [Oceaniglobus ichthyenteri]
MNVAIPKFAEMTHQDLTDRAALALASGNMGSFEWNLVTDEVITDQKLRELWHLPNKILSGAKVFEMIEPKDLPDLNKSVARALNHDEDYNATFRVNRPDDTTVWVSGRGRVVERDQFGKALRLLGLNWDVSQAKDQEDRLIHLVREMNHRVNNAFALIGSMLMIGRETAQDLDGFADMMSTQVHALADAHHLVADFFLHRPDCKDRVRFSAVLDKVMRSWRAGPLASRIVVQLEDDPDLNPQNIAALAMVLYELTSNAAKYSVLGAQTGRLNIHARLKTDDVLHLDWHETLDRPRKTPVGEISGTGFGAILTEHCLSKLKASNIQRNLHDTGFHFAVDIPARPPA